MGNAASITATLAQSGWRANTRDASTQTTSKWTKSLRAASSVTSLLPAVIGRPAREAPKAKSAQWSKGNPKAKGTRAMMP